MDGRGSGRLEGVKINFLGGGGAVFPALGRGNKMLWPGGGGVRGEYNGKFPIISPPWPSMRTPYGREYILKGKGKAAPASRAGSWNIKGNGAKRTYVGL